jgi:hypothetical protein
LVDSGAVVSACELAGVGAAMATWFLRFDDDRGREKGRSASKGEGSVGVL